MQKTGMVHVYTQVNCVSCVWWILVYEDGTGKYMISPLEK